MRPKSLILFMCVLLILVAAVGLFIGYNHKRQANMDDSGEKWQGIITLWDFPRWPDKSGDPFGWIKNKILEFEKEHPGVFIHLRSLKWEYGLIELRAAATSGTNPDIAPIAADCDFILKGYLEPVDEYFLPEELEKYEPKALEAVSYQERIYGFPWFMTTHGLFVNKEMFEANNAVIPEDGFWTYEEFVSELEKVTNINTGDKKDNYGFNIFLSPGSYQVWGFLTMDGAEVFDKNGNFSLNTPEGISALTKLVELGTKYNVVPHDEYGTLEETQVWSDFCEKQKIAVYPTGPWAINILNKRYKSGEGFEFDLVHYPKGRSMASPFVLVSGYGIFKQQDSEKKELCAKFLKNITSEKEQKALAEYGVFPVYLEEPGEIIKDPMIKRMKNMLNAGISLPKVKEWYKVDEIIITQVRQALLTKKTPQQALEDAEKAIKTIMSVN